MSGVDQMINHSPSLNKLMNEFEFMIMGSVSHTAAFLLLSTSSSSKHACCS